MRHLSHSSIGPGGVVPEEWLPVTAQVTKVVKFLSGRYDLVAAVAPGAAAGTGAPAAFFPSLAELHIDTSKCLPAGTRPGTVDLDDPLWRLEHPRFCGVMTHESGHARHTRWTPEILKAAGASEAGAEAVELLEEPRIERLISLRRPEHLTVLRASAIDFVLSEHAPVNSRHSAAAIAALVLGRAAAGILGRGDVEEVRAEVSAIFGKDDYRELERLWKQFLDTNDHGFARMAEIGNRWAEVVGEDEWFENGDRMLEALGAAGIRADSSLVDKRGKERSKRRQEQMAADARQRSKGREVRNRVFGGDNSNGSGTPERYRPDSRKATKQEHRAATLLAEHLMHASDPEASVERFDRPTPPGRMNPRAAMREEAMRAFGDDREVDLFSGTVAVPAPSTRLTIALMSDISGSMRKSAQATASYRWVLSRAATAVGGTIAAVLFGNNVRGVLRAHQMSGTVDVYDCTDGWENFTDGFLAVTAETGLLEASGAKLLVIASDAKFGRIDQVKYARAAMQMCKDAGVGVLWLSFTGSFRTTYGYGTVVDVRKMQPAEVARKVGEAAVEELAACKKS